MDGGHKTLNDAEVVVNDLGKGSEAVGGAGCVGYDLDIGSIAVEVYTADEHRSVILGGTGENDNLSTCIEVGLCLLGGKKCAGAFENILDTHFTPGKLGGVAVADNGNALAVYDDCAVIGLNGAVKATVNGIILYGVCELSGGLVGSVDCDDLDIVGNDCGSENQTTDTAKTVNCYFDHVYTSI